MRKLIGFLLLFTACGTQQNTLVPAEQPILRRILQIRELRTAAAVSWVGLDAPEHDTPLLYYTDSVCYAVNPSPQFRSEFAGTLAYCDHGIEIYKTTLPDSHPFHMETQMDFSDTTAFNGKMPYLFCSSPELTVQTITDVVSDSLWLPMVLHEYVHGFQFRQPGFAAAFAEEDISIPEAELARLHKRNDWFNRAIKAENEALLTALEATDNTGRDSCIRNFITLRTERKQRMTAELGDSLMRAEEVFELMEGGARLVEAQAGFSLGVYSEADKWLYDTDESGYFFATGYNLMRLLDKCGIDKSRLYTERILPLETYLTIKN